MASSRSKKLAVMALVGLAALGVIAVFSGRVVHGHYLAWQLDRARSSEEAAPYLEALGAKAENAGASKVIVGKLGPGREWLTFWFFSHVDSGKLGESLLSREFSQRLESDEKLLRSWSHFVRWKLGTDLWAYLDFLSPVPETGAFASYPCGTGKPRGGSSTFTMPIAFLPNAPPLLSLGGTDGQLKLFAVKWFLGMSPVPAVDTAGSQDQLSDWLERSAPFLRSVVYDDKLGRCKPETETELFPSLTPFSERDWPVPETPLPGWKSPVPN